MSPTRLRTKMTKVGWCAQNVSQFLWIGFFLGQSGRNISESSFFICLNKKPSRRRKFDVTVVSRSQSVSANSEMTVWPQINRKSKKSYFPHKLQAISFPKPLESFPIAISVRELDFFEKSISIWHVSCHDDDLTRHNTRPQVAAKHKRWWKLMSE